MPGYNGKFAPISEDYQKQERKRQRRNSSTTSTPKSPHPVENNVENNVSKNSFVKMGMEDKMNCLFDIMVRFGSMNDKIDSITKHMYYSGAVNDVTESRLRLLEYKSIEMEARQLRGNLLFTGIAESVATENCSDLVYDIINNNLQIDTSSMKITKAFRIGKRQSNNNIRPRSILVTFLDPTITDVIMDNAKSLKNTNYGISRDYPREIREARQELWPDFKQARSLHGAKNVKLKYPAALVINGETVRNEFPGWHDILRGSRNTNVKARVNEKFKRSVHASAAEWEKRSPVVSDFTPDDNSSEGSEDLVVTDDDASVSRKSSQFTGNSQRSRPSKFGKKATLSSPPRSQGYLLGVHAPLQQSEFVSAQNEKSPIERLSEV